MGERRSTPAKKKRAAARSGSRKKPEPQSLEANGVLVHKVKGENPGDVGIVVTSVGACSELEWITLLEMGLKAARARLDG